MDDEIPWPKGGNLNSLNNFIYTASLLMLAEKANNSLRLLESIGQELTRRGHRISYEDFKLTVDEAEVEITPPAMEGDDFFTLNTTTFLKLRAAYSLLLLRAIDHELRRRGYGASYAEYKIKILPTSKPSRLEVR